MRLHAYVTRYLDGMRQSQRRSDKTIEAYERDLRQAAIFFGEDIEIRALDTLSVISWVRSLSSQRITGRSIGRKLSALRGLFQEALNQRLIESNPATNVRAPKAGKHLPNTLSPDAMQRLLEEQRQNILNADSTVTGFNIGNNVGEDAGQTVMHCHTHLIPRRRGDVEEPRGGVRGVIAEKQKY